MIDHMNVVLNFHKGDQMSAKLLLELLLVVDEGIDCTYYLQYGDPTSTIKIRDTLTKFLNRKNARFSNELPNITVPQEMMSNDPNALKYEGNHTIRSTTFKMSMLGWNLCVFKYIYALDSFLMIEPDCCILKQNWLREIYEDYRNYSGPIFGHLKRGRIRGEYVPTHWAGCSIYNSEELRNLPLEKYFYERYENPWWRYRNEKDTETAGNCFWGPAFSGYDITYDYFLFGLYWREKTGVNDPFHWSTNYIEDKQNFILCDFKTKLSADEIFDKFADKLPLMHGIKSDEIRHRMIDYFSRQESADLSLPLSSPEDSPIPKSNNVLLSIGDLKNRFSGRRCFIIGNGPSLRDTDMRILKDEYTIGTNRIYLNYENMGFEPTFYCSVNPNVLEQFAEEIDRVNSVKFVKSESRKYLKNTWNTFFMDSIPTIGFNEDLESLSWHEGWTVTFCAMQVAFYLGFDTVILIGVDHFFKEAGEPNKLVIANGDDPNHFHPSYFGKDVKWQYPDLKRSEQSYRIAKEVFEKHGRRILDATVGGKLQVFPKVDYPSLFDKQKQVSHMSTSSNEERKPIVSIIMPAFNASGSIGAAIASIQSQSFADWELVVVDDGSLDDTREVVVRLAGADSRIRLFQCKGKGVSDARNTGLDAARGEFITFLDADDFMYPNALKRRVEALKKNPGWNLVHCVTDMVDADSKKMGWQLGRPKEVSFKDMNGSVCSINSLLGRSQVFKSVRFQSGLTNAEDWLFFSDILRTGEVSHRVARCSVAYVVRRDSAVCGDYLSHENKLLEVMDIIYSPVRNNLPAAPEFAQGLSSPPKEAVLLRRMIGLLTWLLLEQRANDVTGVLSEFSDQDLSALSRSEIRNQIIYPAMRFYVCRKEELPERLHKDEASILRLISETGIEKTFHQYADEFKLLMGKASTNELNSMHVSDNIVGPFKRNAHAHIDENALVATLLVDQTKTGVMIDVGALHGSTLAPFCRRGWRVFAFEPDPANREELETRFGHNPNVTIDGRAVADRIVENMPFYSSAVSPGISSLHPFHKSHKEACTVSTTTIADFVREKDLHHIDYLKIDAEGYDLLVLKGVPWERIKPNVIMCEFEDSKTRSLGYTMHDMARYLTERGYKVMVSEWHPVIRYGRKHDWHRLVPYPCELHDPNAWGNLIAFRDQPDLQRIATIARRIVKVDKVALQGGMKVTSLRARGLYQRLVDYLKTHYPAIITIGRFVKWGLTTLKSTFFGIGGIAVLVTLGLYIAGALIEPARWYLVGTASALLLLFGGLLALFYARFILNRFVSDQRTQVSDIKKEVSEINKQVSNINRQVSDIKKEVAPYDDVDHLRLERAVSIEKQVEVAELQYDLRDSKPILFFNATSGPGTLSFASTSGLIISWGLRLAGHRVLHLVCRKGLRRCIQGTNRYEPNQPMPCETCYAIKDKMFPQDLRRYLELKSEGPSALIPLESYSLDDLADFVYQGINIGELCISSVRWTLRRHNLDSVPRSTRLLREYIRGGMNIVDTLQRLLQEQELHSIVVFNGVFYPEAIAREVALQKGLPVVAYEISIPDLKVFLSHGVAAGGGLITIPEDFQMSATQEAEFDQYMSQRIRGTVGQPGLWPEMNSIEPELRAFAGQYKNVVCVFTNVIFDTSQYGANTVFESMFDWLDEIMKLASLHPETLFVVRAHPAEVFPRHESEELVGDWLKEHSYLAIPNVRFIPPTDYISSYDLLNISRFCLVYNSTIGLEAVVLGIPTVTAAAGRYSGAGVTHAPASRKAYGKLVETFLKNGPPPVEDTVRQRARYCMYQLFFRQGLDLSAFLESPDWTLKPIDASALHPDNSPEMNIIYKGIMEGGPFYYPH